MKALKRLFLIRRVSALIAAVMLAVPNAALPCTSGNCCGDESIESVLPAAASGCCATFRSEITESPAQTDQESRDHQGAHGDCECPPGCPSACGAGKPPCTSTLTIVAGIDEIPVRRLIEFPQLITSTPDLGDLFRPPRV